LRRRRLTDMRAYFFDLDGCVYFSNKLASGSKELLQQIRSEQKKVCFITNNSRQTALEVSLKLEGLGLEVRPEEIITATECVGKYIKERYGLVRAKVAGSLSLQRSMTEFGHTVEPFINKSQADVIVIGRDTEFDYEKLRQIVFEADQGVRIISANPDLYHPGSLGEKVPETGSIVTSVEAIIGQKVEYVGKPAPFLFQYGMEVCGIEPHESVMVGDNLRTDIKGGAHSGMTTVWITGRSVQEKQDAIELKPDYIVENMEDLLLLYNQGETQSLT
jgi:4-nitrophenyl phosphatase